MPEVKKKLKQQIQAKAQRIRRYEKRGKQLRQNKLFKENTKKFYRELGKKKIDIDEPPKLKEIEDVWIKVWKDEKQYNETAEWIKQEEKIMGNHQTQEWKDLEQEDIIISLKKACHWRSPGIDKVSNFWLKNLDEVATRRYGKRI